MTRPSQSYAELQRQHIIAQLTRRQAAQREAELSSWQMAADDVATSPSTVKVHAVKH
jgi:hypothetical protein